MYDCILHVITDFDIYKYIDLIGLFRSGTSTKKSQLHRLLNLYSSRLSHPYKKNENHIILLLTLCFGLRGN